MLSKSQWTEGLRHQNYLIDEDLAVMVSLAVKLNRPLLVEGPAGSGKTQLAYALAGSMERELIRLSCYEGLDASQALYDWNYQRQLLALRQDAEVNLFHTEFLMERPLLRALRSRGAVLLIDEVDRSDEGFEALLLEYLADQQISIPEWGTVRASAPLVSILTSNRTRPLSDALRRRCLYAYLDWPRREREMEIVALYAPNLGQDILQKLVDAVTCLRSWQLIKPPGLAETIDWGRSQEVMGIPGVTRDWVSQTLGTVVKDAIDLDTVRGRLDELVLG